MKSIIAEIYVNNCKEALEFYKEAFGGEIRNVRTGQGIEMFKGHEDKIIHSELHINPNCVMYLVDTFGEIEGSNINLVLEMDSEEEINRVYSFLKNKGTVKYELQKTFWGALHAVVTDTYGNTWGLNCMIK